MDCMPRWPCEVWALGWLWRLPIKNCKILLSIKRLKGKCELIKEGGHWRGKPRLICKVVQFTTYSIATATAAAPTKERTWRNPLPSLSIDVKQQCIVWTSNHNGNKLSMTYIVKPLAAFNLCKLKVELLWHSLNLHPCCSKSLQTPNPQAFWAH